MFKKIYDIVLSFIKENYKFLIFIIFFYLVLTFPLPFYIYTGGGTIDIDEKIELEEDKNNSSSYHFAYVSEAEATVITYLASFILPGWDATPIDDYQINEEETVEDINMRNVIALENANQEAVKLAYTKAGKDFTINDISFYVQYISEESITDIKIGDQLLKVDNQEITSVDEYREYVKSKEVGQSLTLEVLRDDKTLTKTIEVVLIEGEKLTGISVVPIYDYITDPKIEINFASNESGPSGGFMLTLFIYNQLLDEELVSDLKIVGTGTIDEEGNVGPIGGVKYKLAGAVSEKADIFFAPTGDNYEECIALQKEHNYDIEIVEVKELDDAINYLLSLQ